MSMAAKKRAKRVSRAEEPEIIPPRKSGEIEVRVDANYLRTLAAVTRQAVVKTMLPMTLKTMVWAARSGQLQARIEWPSTGAVDPESSAEAVCEALRGLGINARPAWVEAVDRYGSGKRLVIECIWRDTLR